jgi:hypothetical protein
MSDTSEIFRIMPREMRLMSERILSLTNLPKGFALMVGDAAMYSESMDLGGFALLEERIDILKETDLTAIRIVSEDGQRIVLDAGKQHAWFVVPAALDLLDDRLGASQIAIVEITNVADPAELAIGAAIGRRTGLEIDVEETTLSAVAAEPADPVLDKILENGCAIPSELWWRIYALAQTALAPDSVVSRRHAGPIIVTDNGKVIGRTDNDDDTDIRFITNTGAEPERAHS